jgi:hypothetical protein
MGPDLGSAASNGGEPKVERKKWITSSDLKTDEGKKLLAYLRGCRAIGFYGLFGKYHEVWMEFRMDADGNFWVDDYQVPGIFGSEHWDAQFILAQKCAALKKIIKNSTSCRCLGKSCEYQASFLVDIAAYAKCHNNDVDTLYIRTVDLTYKAVVTRVPKSALLVKTVTSMPEKRIKKQRKSRGGPVHAGDGDVGKPVSISEDSPAKVDGASDVSIPAPKPKIEKKDKPEGMGPDGVSAAGVSSPRPVQKTETSGKTLLNRMRPSRRNEGRPKQETKLPEAVQKTDPGSKSGNKFPSNDRVENASTDAGGDGPALVVDGTQTQVPSTEMANQKTKSEKPKKSNESKKPIEAEKVAKDKQSKAVNADKKGRRGKKKNNGNKGGVAKVYVAA